MRRLPVFFLIDVSESMIGNARTQVETGLRDVIQGLKRDPYALETAYISIIVFAGKTKTIVPLTELASFYPPSIPIGGGTALGAGLKHLIAEIDKSVVKNSTTKKGDWKPIIFLMTDGEPTDDYKTTVQIWEHNYKEKYNLVAIAIGENTRTDILKKLTDTVLVFNDTEPDAYQKFFKWVTDSIIVSSHSIGNNDYKNVDLAELDESLLSKKTKSAHYGIDNTIILHGQCQNKKIDYLIKYNRQDEESEFTGLPVVGFALEGAYPINNDYYNLTEKEPSNKFTNTEDLFSFPTCPCCGNQFGFTVCGNCQRIFCSKGEGVNSCPWCHTTAFYSFGSGNMDIGRNQG